MCAVYARLVLRVAARGSPQPPVVSELDDRRRGAEVVALGPDRQRDTALTSSARHGGTPLAGAAAAGAGVQLIAPRRRSSPPRRSSTTTWAFSWPLRDTWRGGRQKAGARARRSWTARRGASSLEGATRFADALGVWSDAITAARAGGRTDLLPVLEAAVARVRIPTKPNGSSDPSRTPSPSEAEHLVRAKTSSRTGAP